MKISAIADFHPLRLLLQSADGAFTVIERRAEHDDATQRRGSEAISSHVLARQDSGNGRTRNRQGR